MYKKSWGLKRICPCNRILYYDLGKTELECPECGKEIEVTNILRPRRGRRPGSTNSTPLINVNTPKVEEKKNELNIENLNIENDSEITEDDAVLLEDDNDVDPTVDVGIKPTEENKEEDL